MRGRPLQLRDRGVAVLARLSLVVVLAVMGALFVGSAQPQASATEAATVSVVPDPPQQTQDADGLLDHADPVGLVLGLLVIGGGVGVLLVGAFRPHRRASHHELAELLRR